MTNSLPRRGDTIIRDGIATEQFQVYLEESELDTGTIDTRIADVEADITALEASDTSQSAQIGANSSNITVNAADIATNAANIVTNVSAVATNAADIIELNTLANALRTYLLGDRLFSGNPDLAIDTNFDVQANNAIVVSIDGVLASIAAGTVDTGTSATFPAGLWGVFLVAVDSAGTFSSTWNDNATTGFSSEALAIAAIPSAPTAEAPVGYVTVQAAAGFSFTAGTDALTGGTGGNPAQTTSYYNVADPGFVIGAAV